MSEKSEVELEEPCAPRGREMTFERKVELLRNADAERVDEIWRVLYCVGFGNACEEFSRAAYAAGWKLDIDLWVKADA